MADDRIWFRQDAAELSEEWLNEDLEPGARWAYQGLKGYIKVERPSQKRHSRAIRLGYRAAARRWNVSPNDVQAMEKAAIKAGKLVIEGDEWVLTDLSVCASEDTVRRQAASTESSGFAPQTTANTPQTSAPCKKTVTETETETETDLTILPAGPARGLWSAAIGHTDPLVSAIARASFPIEKFRANLPKDVAVVERIVAKARAMGQPDAVLIKVAADCGGYFDGQSEIKNVGQWWMEFYRWCERRQKNGDWPELPVSGTPITAEDERAAEKERNRQRSLAMQGDGTPPEVAPWQRFKEDYGDPD